VLAPVVEPPPLDDALPVGADAFELPDDLAGEGAVEVAAAEPVAVEPDAWADFSWSFLALC
jgi:hypothetical protein